MPDPAWPLVKDDLAKAVCARTELEPPALALLDDDAAPREFFRTLRAKGFVADAVKLLAAALDKRDAVWWACRAARSAPPDANPLDAKAVSLAEEWALSPSEDKGRAAYALAEQLNHKTPGAWCALAAFWAGPNIAVEVPGAEVPPAAPPPNLYANAVAASLLFTIGAGPPKDIVNRQSAVLDLGDRVAAGKDSWKDATR